MLSDESLKQRSNWKIESWGLRKLAPYWSGGVNLGAQLVFADRGHPLILSLSKDCVSPNKGAAGSGCGGFGG